jgi:LacI family transcriptional regulator
MKQHTISDIAKELGVSTASISRALTNSPGVSDELRNKIVEYCKTIGYETKKVNSAANLIGIVLGDIRNPYYSNLVFAIEKILSAEKYVSIIFNSEYDDEKEISFIRSARKYNLAGLMLITANTDKIAHLLNEIDIPKVLVNRNVTGYAGDSVLIDNFQSGYEATLHLIGLGHQDIGFIKGPENSTASTARYEGFCRAVANYHYEIHDEWIWNSRLNIESGRKVAQSFLKLSKRPTAIVSVNDTTTVGFIDELKINGLSVPEDVSIISFDNIEMTGLKDLKITTMNHKAEEMGNTAAKLLLEQLSGAPRASKRIILEPELIVRGTTAEIRPS